MILNNKKFIASALSLFLLFVLIMPVLLFAQNNGAGNAPGPFLPPVQNDPSLPASNPYQITGGLNNISAPAQVSTGGLVKCGIADSSGKIANPCDFTDFIALINDIIKWIISIATSIFTIMAVWGGFLYMTSGTKIGDKEKAKSILWNTLLGFVIILCAWLIIFTLLNFLIPKTGPQNSIFNFLGGVRY